MQITEIQNEMEFPMWFRRFLVYMEGGQNCNPVCGILNTRDRIIAGTPIKHVDKLPYGVQDFERTD